MSVSDVVIIGGGIAGASLGYRLAPHCKVTLLEAEPQPGYHSTGRSAALFTTTYGHQVIRALTIASRDFLLGPPEGFTATPLLTERRCLWIARPDQTRALDAFLAEVSVLDPTVAPCAVEDALSLCPILNPDYLAAAVIEPEAYDIDVNALHQGYLAGFRRAGGMVATSERVTAIRRTSSGWDVATNGGRHACQVVVNAAGAWADEVAALAGVAQVGLVPKRRTAITFDLPAGTDPGHWPCVLDTDEKFYFRPDAGRLMASPADETPSPPCDAQPEELDIAVTVDRVETATTLSIRRIASKWAGLRSFVADKVPVVGVDPAAPGFFWLAGQGGYGIMTSPALSEVAAALILDAPFPSDSAALGVTAADLSAARLRAAPAPSN
jgi:D-arginine dehydrogenase